MKNIKEIKRRFISMLKKISICAVSASFILSSASSHALADNKHKYDDSKGFDDDKQEEVWMVYGITSWEDVSGLVFSNNTMISTNVPSDFKEKWTKVISDQLKANNQTSQYNKQDYLPIILDMVYHLHKKGSSLLTGITGSWQEQDQSDIEEKKKEYMDKGMSESDAEEQAKKDVSYNGPDNDIAYIQHIYGLSDAPKDNKTGIAILIREFFTNENRLMKASKDTADFSYAIDDEDSPGLWCVVQATIYSGSKGHDYSDESPKCSYSADKSKKFREKYDDIVNYDGFADDVKKDYNATEFENVDDANQMLSGFDTSDD